MCIQFILLTQNTFGLKRQRMEFDDFEKYLKRT